MMHKILVFFVFTIFFGQLAAQDYNVAHYDVDEGLSQSYVYDIVQDHQGFLWIATGEGLTRYDGKDFVVHNTSNGLVENFVHSLMLDDNNRMWVGHNSGGITLLKGSRIDTLRLPNISSTITTILNDPVSDANWVFSLNDGFYHLKGRQYFHSGEAFEGLNIKTAAISGSGKLLIGTTDGLSVVKLEPRSRVPLAHQPMAEFEYQTINKVVAASWSDEAFLVATDEGGLFVVDLTDKQPKVTRVAAHLGSLGNIQDIVFDLDHNVYLATFGAGVIKLMYDAGSSNYREKVTINDANGLKGNFAKCLYYDRENNLWVGSFGAGVSYLSDESFVFYFQKQGDAREKIHAVYITDSIKWFGTGNGLIALDESVDSAVVRIGAAQGMPNDKVMAIAVTPGQQVYAGTSASGLYVRPAKNAPFQRVTLDIAELQERITSMVWNHGSLWMGTLGGLVRYTPESGKVDFLTTADGLIHNHITHVIAGTDSSVWACAFGNGIMQVTGKRVKIHNIPNFNQPLEAVGMAFDLDHRLWLATAGTGIVLLNGDSAHFFRADHGLLSDYSYGLICDQNGTMWVGHRGGLSRVNTRSFDISVLSKNDGIKSDILANALYRDPTGNVWFGTDDGVIRYDPTKDKRTTLPPAAVLKSLTINELAYSGEEEIELNYEKYRLKVEFIGVGFKNIEHLTYSYFLEGHDLQWSELGPENTAFYSRLEDGEYRLLVKTCFDGDNCSESVALFTVRVNNPYWKTWWFALIVVAGVSLSIWLIIVFRERQLRSDQLRLEEELGLRTHELVLQQKEVMAQKEELADKNKDITDSINYALRIQRSLLPDKKILAATLPKSFIFYEPRDIVSGDFYWYDQVGDYFLIACADCTGHGVPGAFMSMIGIASLREIVSTYGETDPGQVLKKLDEQIVHHLRQDQQENAYDGMDISLLSIHLPTRELRYAGAMRPVVFVEDGVSERVRTTVQSIGGIADKQKEFTTFTRKMKEGDRIYMFSDGYPDQFGGMKGKKMFLRGVMKLIEGLRKRPMDQQFMSVSTYFKVWQGSLDQVDDVLFIGIEL